MIVQGISSISWRGRRSLWRSLALELLHFSLFSKDYLLYISSFLFLQFLLFLSSIRIPITPTLTHSYLALWFLTLDLPLPSAKTQLWALGSCIWVVPQEWSRNLQATDFKTRTLRSWMHACQIITQRSVLTMWMKLLSMRQ